MARPSTLAFLRTESGAGALLAAAALAGLIMANSPFADSYVGFIHTSVPVRLGAFAQDRDVLGWSRDGLMALFFLLVGMEVKFEVLRGEFSSPRRLALPILAAVGGMAGPALVFLAVNGGTGRWPAAWAIPTPTDVAFSLAALALFGRRLPQSLRLFLLTLAVADDLGAVVLIGALFTTPLHPNPLSGAVLTLAALAALSRWRSAPRLLYAAGFLLVWGFALQSGINTSVAGFACALTVPIGGRRTDGLGSLESFMKGLHPYVAFAVLPLFAFVSAGFPLAALTFRGAGSPLTLGVALGLLVGKPLGVMALSALAVACRIGRRPLGANWLELFGVACLCGAGFTMSFFIGALALGAGNLAAQDELRAAVIAGSLLSVLAGGAVLRLAARRGRGVAPNG